MTKTISTTLGWTLTALVFVAAYTFVQTAHADDTRRCNPTVSSSAWSGGNAAPGSHMYQVFNAAFLRR